jgi:hypothetical protein
MHRRTRRPWRSVDIVSSICTPSNTPLAYRGLWATDYLPDTGEVALKVPSYSANGANGKPFSLHIGFQRVLECGAEPHFHR